MYLTEKHLCYYRSVMTMSKKIKVAWTEIASIVSKGSSDIIINQMKSDEKKIVFSGFSNRNKSFDYIKRLW